MWAQKTQRWNKTPTPPTSSASGKFPSMVIEGHWESPSQSWAISISNEIFLTLASQSLLSFLWSYFLLKMRRERHKERFSEKSWVCVGRDQGWEAAMLALITTSGAFLEYIPQMPLLFASTLFEKLIPAWMAFDWPFIKCISSYTLIRSVWIAA